MNEHPIMLCEHCGRTQQSARIAGSTHCNAPFTLQPHAFTKKHPYLTGKPRLIFVCSPFRATAKNGLAKHIDYAKAACRQVFEEGDHPFAPHLLYPSFLNDHNADHRRWGIEAGLTILSACDQLSVFSELGVSEGMQQEIDFATQRTIPVVFRNLKTISPPLEEKSSQSQKTY